MTVHGDDFTSTGREKDLRWLDSKLRAKFEIKTDILGPSKDYAKQVRVLNRVTTWTDDGITYEADQRHAEIIVGSLEVTKAVSTPGSRDDAAKAGKPGTWSSPTMDETCGDIEAGQGSTPLQLSHPGGMKELQTVQPRTAWFWASPKKHGLFTGERPT